MRGSGVVLSTFHMLTNLIFTITLEERRALLLEVRKLRQKVKLLAGGSVI